MRALKDGADRDSELLLAAVAVVQPRAVLLATDQRGVLGLSAVGAEPARSPAQRLKVLTGGGFVGEDGVRQVYGFAPKTMG